MKKSQPYYNLIILFLFCLNLAAQDSTAIKKLNAFTRHFNTFAKDYPQEKVYLHFDNTAYYLGETIWFKGYVVRADGNSLSQLSKTLYVELITAEGNVLETKKLKIENGQCHGELQLRDSLFSGFYEVRAYTRYMLNQDKEYLFSRVFPVYEKPKKNNGDYSNPRMRERNNSQRVPQFRKEYEQKGKLALSFYPEGGNLIKGLQSRVAFKATGKNGENALITGEILDATGNKEADLETIYQGMGIFEFTPGAGEYSAKVRYDNREYRFDLPKMLTSGYSLSIDASDSDKINVLIRKSSQLPADTLGITVSCRGILYASDYVTTDKENIASLTIPSRILPSGVSQITLFNTSGERLCERLVFVNHNSQMKMSVEQDKRSYPPFGKVNLDFRLNDMKSSPVETTFSLSVRDAATSTYNPYNDNILTNLLLCSELRGYIENPGYYFESNDPARKSGLDLLMLTQGWSRYVWKDMTGRTSYNVKHPIEKSLVIEGHVLSLYKKKPKASVEVQMFMTQSDSTSQRGTCLTDNEGKFNFALTDFKGKAKLSLQTKEKGKRSENNIILDRMFSPEFKVYAYKEKQSPENVMLRRDSVLVKADTMKIIVVKEELAEKEEQPSNLPMDKKQHRLKGVVVKAPMNFKREGEGLRNATVVYDVEKSVDEMIDKGENEPSNILDFLVTKNPYFSYSYDKIIPKNTKKEKGEYSVDALHARYKGRNVIFCINNRTLANTDIFDKLYNNEDVDNNIKGIYSTEIESVTINETEGNSFVYGGVDGDEVVIFIYTYKDLHYRNSIFSMRQTKLNGYSYTKEFFSPQYNQTPPPDIQDYRRTLYWNPDVRTDKDGKATISFYNNGSCKKMNINAETVTEKGIIGVLNY